MVINQKLKKINGSIGVKDSYDRNTNNQASERSVPYFSSLPILASKYRSLSIRKFLKAVGRSLMMPWQPMATAFFQPYSSLTIQKKVRMPRFWR
jgi:hypothetical protein